MRIHAFLVCLAVVQGVSSGRADDYASNFEGALPAGQNLISRPESLMNRKVRVTFMTRCFSWGGAFNCFANNAQLMVSSTELRDESVREFIESNCRSLSQASRCPVDIVFVVKKFGTDATGSIRTITTDEIWARKRI